MPPKARRLLPPCSATSFRLSRASSSSSPRFRGELGGTSIPTTHLLGLISAYSGKVADNGVAAPVDRVYIGYNYYGNIYGSGGSADIETLGFEKTFAGGYASIGMVVPFIQSSGVGSGSSSVVGDLSISGKYAFYKNCDTGDLISGGLVITVPTGPSSITGTGSTINPIVFQPYVGYIFYWRRLPARLLLGDGRRPTATWAPCGSTTSASATSCSRTAPATG